MADRAIALLRVQHTDRIDEIVVQDSRRQTRSLVLFSLVQKIPNCLNKNLG